MKMKSLTHDKIAEVTGDYEGLTVCDFDGIRAVVDLEATRAWYETAGGWDCTCGHCRNLMVLARERRLPDWVLEVLDRLGISAGKPTCACEYCYVGEDLLYSVNYRLCGFLPDGDGQSGSVRHPGDGNILCGRDEAPAAADGFPEPWFDLIFFCTLPWVLDEPREGPKD